MDLRGQPVRGLRACGRARPHEAAGARLVAITGLAPGHAGCGKTRLACHPEESAILIGGRRRIAHCLENTQGEILRFALGRAVQGFAQNDSLEEFFRSLISPACRPKGRRHCGMLKKDVKFGGTNSISSLASTKVSKKRTQKGPKIVQKTCRKCEERPKQSEQETQKGNVPARLSYHALPLCVGRPEKHTIRVLKKDVKIGRTKSISPLASTTVSKKRTQKGPKKAQKTCRKC